MNFRTLDLNLLRVFDAVMAERNLTRAADRLSLTQPAVSNALKRLRDWVGEDLVTREAHGVRPTQRAETLWPEVRAALSQLRGAFEPGEFDPARDAATFRLAMADATAAMLLPGLVSRIEQVGARANLRVLPLTGHDPRELLDRGDADIAVGHFPAVLAALVSSGGAGSLHHQRLYDSDYVCVMRQGHPLAGAPLTLDAYCEAHHLMVSVSGHDQGSVDDRLATLGRSRRIVLTVNQFFTAGRVVAQSDLLTVLPARFVASTGCQERLLQRPLPLAIPPVQITAMWHLRDDRDQAHRWLREQLRDTALADVGSPTPPEHPVPPEPPRPHGVGHGEPPGEARSPARRARPPAARAA